MAVLDCGSEEAGISRVGTFCWNEKGLRDSSAVIVRDNWCSPAVVPVVLLADVIVAELCSPDVDIEDDGIMRVGMSCCRRGGLFGRSSVATSELRRSSSSLSVGFFEGEKSRVSICFCFIL